MKRARNRIQTKARTKALTKLARCIGYEFKDLALLDRALCHASTGNQGRESYERMEFLGDAFLGFAIADSLYRDNPELGEGELTEARSRVVSRAPLAAVARRLDLISCLDVGKGLRNEARHSQRILADLVEAVLAAIYLDGGVRPARRFVKNHVLATVGKGATKGPPNRDAKTRLLHFVQRRGQGQPLYEVIAVTGPQHEQVFEVLVVIQEEELATGTGRNKQEAEKEAAGAALAILREREEDAAG